MGNVNSVPHQRQEEEEGLLMQELGQEQRQIEKLTLEKHDQLLLFKISNVESLKEKFCTNLPIVDIIDQMGSFVPQKYKKNIMKIKEENGSYAATRKFLSLATKKILKSGWSHQLLQILKTLNLEELISLDEADLEEFVELIGIPRNSLLRQLCEKQRAHCSILVSPMGRMEENSQDVPIVHPQLQISGNHFEKNTAFTDGTYKQSEEIRQAYKEAPRISFKDITKSNVETPEFTNEYSKSLREQHALSLCFIGPAGSGKTTMTKRMVKTWIEGKKMAFLIPFAQIDENERQSLKTLLIEFLCRLHTLEHDPSEEDIDEAFQWILENQDQCLLVFDGLDQSSFDISSEPIVGDINDEFLPGDLMSLLLSRKFLPNIRIAVTSRPHSLAQFAPAIQPNIVVFLNDLLSDDVEKLMNHYLVNGDHAGEIIEKLRIKSPRIHQLIFNPLLLRLVAMLSNEVEQNIWEYVNTIAKLFYEVVEKLQSSAHHECGLDVDDVKVLNRKLAEMAFNKTIEGSVVFEQSDLERYGLSGENTQDFLFGVMKKTSSKHNNALLVGLMLVFYFNHQSTQEFFSARFALEQMPVDEFKEFVGKLFPRIGYKDSFANLRIFVIGIINEMKNRKIDEEEILMKKNIFIKILSEHLQQIFVEEARYDVKNHQKQLMVDMMDFREEEICSEIREQLKDVNFWFDYYVWSDLKVAAHREAFFYFLQHFTSNVGGLWLNIMDWKVEEIRKLFQSIQLLNVKIEEMRIWMNTKQAREHGREYMKDLVATFPHFTRKLWLRFERDDDLLDKLKGEVDERRFCRKLMEEINNFDTSTLQTQELKVKVKEHRYDGDDKILLDVILRRGQSPQFIKSVSCLDNCCWGSFNLLKCLTFPCWYPVASCCCDDDGCCNLCDC